MRILLLHNRYQIQGGEDIVVAQETAMLRDLGVSVDVFEITNDAISSMREKIFTTVQVVYSPQMREQVRDRIRRFQADVVHVHNFFPRFTPSVYDAAKREGCGVVQTLHNYRLLCAGGLLFREQKICTECLTQGNALPALIHRCYRQSIIGTAALAGMTTIHKVRGTWRDRVDRFITLTSFARSLFIEHAGIPADRLTVKANVVPDIGVERGEKRYALFVGRLSPEKGISSLLLAAKSSAFPLPLLIVGSGPMENEVRAAAEPGRIEFLGKKPSAEVHSLLRGAKMLLAPSMWHEAGVPLVIGEAFSAGIPVVTCRVKPMDSVVENERNGLLVTPGSGEELCAAAAKLHTDPELWERMCLEARRTYEQLYMPETNGRVLLDIYRSTLKMKNSNSLAQKSGGSRQIDS